MAKLTEEQFLIRFAVKHFNEQFKKSFNPDLFQVRSIPVRYSCECSYEIYTTRLDDNLRLHIHIRFEGIDGLRPYRVEVDSILSQLPGSEGSVNDEVYVALGNISKHYRHEDIYKFRPINMAAYTRNVLLLENGQPILLEDGSPILLEED